MDKSARLPRRARVLSNRLLCETGTVYISFEIIDGEAFSFEPGQFVAIDMNHPHYGYKRSPYCIASPVSKPDRFDLLVRIIPEGPVSVFLGELEPHDLISFGRPTGRIFNLREETELILLATGVGISPFLPLVFNLARQDYPHPIRLFWGLRQEEDICLTDVLDSWATNYPIFSYQISLSQAPEDWQGLCGRLTESVPPLLKTLKDKNYFLCGNGAMIAEMTNALSLAGVPLQRFCDECFFNVRHNPDHQRVNEIHSRFRAKDREKTPFAEIARFLKS